jgi:hypothetical protein
MKTKDEDILPNMHQIFVSETIRTIKTKMKEHSAAKRFGYLEKSAVGDANGGHDIDISNPKIFAREEHFETRIFGDAL